jgi:hypothetical protein
VHATFADAEAYCFNVQFMLQPVEDLVADRAVIPHADQRHPFGSKRFMAEPPKGLG